MKLSEALQVLELKPGCSFRDAKKAYKELIQVWHSDRHRHNPRLLERAHQKTQTLNQAWGFISAIGEEQFGERSKSEQVKEVQSEPARKSSFNHSSNEARAEPFQKTKSRQPMNLRAYQPTGIILRPIWNTSGHSRKRGTVVKKAQLILSGLLLATGLLLAPRIYRQLRLSISGISTNGQITLCGDDGQNSQVIIEGDSVAMNIPQNMLRLAMSKTGKILYSCPEYISVIYSKDHPEYTRIGGNVGDLWISSIIHLVIFCLVPVALVKRARLVKE